MTIKTGMSVEQVKEQMDHATRVALLPALRSDISKLMDGVQARVFNAIRSGTFDSSMAEASWRELYSYHSLLKHYEVQVSLGTKE